MKGYHIRIFTGVAVALCAWATLSRAETARAVRAGTTRSAAVPGEVRILRVEAVPVAPSSRAALGTLQGRYLPKFVADAQVAGPQYQVTWRTPRAGLDRGATVYFEYRLAGDDTLRRVATRLTGSLQGEVTTIVLLPGSSVPTADVASWRVVVATGQTFLAERLSPTWRARG